MPPTPTVDASAIDSIPVHAALQAALSDPTFLPSGEQSTALALHAHTLRPTFANQGAAQPAGMLIRVEVVMAEQKNCCCAGGTVGLACSHRYYHSDEFRSLAEHMLKGTTPSGGHMVLFCTSFSVWEVCYMAQDPESMSKLQVVTPWHLLWPAGCTRSPG